jgi:hypothetical protein
MVSQAYFGLNCEDEHSWILAQRTEGESPILQRFKNTLDGLKALVEFISSCGDRPRIFIKSTSKSAFRLLKHLSIIPAAEVMFVSEAGFRQYRNWLPKDANSASPQVHASEILARCAERIV